MDAEARAQRAVERLSEDEALRRDLTDSGFGPVLDWATAQATRLAAEAPDAETFEARFEALRALGRAIGEAASTRSTAGLSEQLGAALGEKDAAAARGALSGIALGEDTDANARAIVDALGGVPPGRVQCI